MTSREAETRAMTRRRTQGTEYDQAASATGRAVELDSLRQGWDRDHPDGEGIMAADSGPLSGARAQWVRVYRDREMTAAIATFYVYSFAGTIVRLDRVRDRRGAIPNPYDIDPADSVVGWG